MATLTKELGEQRVSDGLYPVVVLIRHRNHTRRQVNTEVYIKGNEWDNSPIKDERKVLSSNPTYRAKNRKIDRVIFDLEDIIEDFEKNRKQYTPEQIKAVYKGINNKPTMFEFIVSEIEKAPSQSTKDNYQNMLKALMKFQKYDIFYDSVNVNWIERWKDDFKSRGIRGVNYLKDFRSIYNRAKRNGVAPDISLFGDGGIKVGKNLQRDIEITLDDVKAIMSYEPKENKHDSFNSIEFALDMFKVMFYCRGLECKDLILLKKSDIRNGKIVYDRSKISHYGGKIIQIPIYPELQFLIDKYSHKRKVYLFPLLGDHVQGEKMVHNAVKRIRNQRLNPKLRVIGKELGFNFNLTTKLAKHFYGSALQTLNISDDLFSKLLDHNDSSLKIRYKKMNLDKEMNEVHGEVLKIVG